jgi:hypothetical protein
MAGGQHHLACGQDLGQHVEVLTCERDHGRSLNPRLSGLTYSASRSRLRLCFLCHTPNFSPPSRDIAVPTPHV